MLVTLVVAHRFTSELYRFRRYFIIYADICLETVTLLNKHSSAMFKLLGYITKVSCNS